MWMTPLDVSSFITQAIMHVAEQMKIPDFELTSPTELVKVISDKDAKVGDALLDFALAYEEWYAVNQRIEHGGRTERRLELLVERVRNRDAARTALKTALARYQ